MELDVLPLSRSPSVLLLFAAANCAGPAQRKTVPATPQATPQAALSETEAAGASSAVCDGGACAVSSVTTLATAPGTQSGSECDAGREACAQPPAAAPKPPSELPKGTTVLHIGDSMAGALGITLNDELKKHGVRGVLRFKTASFIPTWAWAKDLPVYLAQYKPDLVVISLGTNEVQIRQPESRIQLIQKLVAKLGDRPCVWILPPLWEVGDTGLLPVIQAHAAPCRVMDTAKVFPNMPRLGDKIHPTISARGIWSQRVVDWLQHERDPNGVKPWSFRNPKAP